MNPKEAKILVVDDEAANVMLLTKVLANYDFKNVQSTQIASEVVALYEEFQFDLILLDINMPGMNGYEVLEQLQSLESFKNTKVIASSADKPLESNQDDIKYNFYDYIPKPMRIQGIIEIVNKALH